MTVTVHSERCGHTITYFFCLLLKNTTWKICGFNRKVPHATQIERTIARDISWLRNFSSWWYQLATKIMRFDTIRRFLWSCATECVYADKPEHLKTSICQVMAEIPPNTYQKVIDNYLKRINACNTSRGRHLNDVVFFTHNVNVQTL